MFALFGLNLRARIPVQYHNDEVRVPCRNDTEEEGNTTAVPGKSLAT